MAKDKKPPYEIEAQVLETVQPNSGLFAFLENVQARLYSALHIPNKDLRPEGEKPWGARTNTVSGRAIFAVSVRQVSFVMNMIQLITGRTRERDRGS